MGEAGLKWRLGVAVGAALLAAGCTAAGGNATAADEANQATAAAAPTSAQGGNAASAAGTPALQLEAEGLRLADEPVPFGAGQDELLARLAFLGTAEVETNEECGAGPLAIAQFPGGLSLLFQEGRFAGWSADGRAPAAAATGEGIAAGRSTRAELEAAYPGMSVEESTLGLEFAAGGLGGLLEGPGREARVRALWAGTTCMFR